MKALLLIVIVLCGAIGVVAQKKSTLVGDLVIGELTGTNESTREITIKYPGKEGPEIFTGTLVDGSRLKMADNNRRNLMLSEIVPGLHIRVFYKTGEEKVGGQKRKVNKISRLEVLGEDEHFRIRRQLSLDPTTPIAHAETGDDLPAASPLKVFLAIHYKEVHQDLVEWIDKWNRKNGDSYGKLEIVSDLDHANTSIVVARGADTMVAELPAESYYGDKVLKGTWIQATSYLVVKDAGRLKVLWSSVAHVLTTPNTELSPRTTALVIAELEKRMKARAGNSKKYLVPSRARLGDSEIHFQPKL